MEQGPQPYMFQPVRRRSSADASAMGTSSATSQQLATQVSRLTNVDWCTCNSCAIMQSETECLCCHEIAALNVHFNELGPGLQESACIKSHPDLPALTLSRAVLRATYIMQRNVRGDVKTVPLVLENRKYRFIAYRIFTAWAHGPLGKKNRQVIPSCVVNAIRNEFPADDGNYAGFQYPETSEVQEALQFD